MHVMAHSEWRRKTMKNEIKHDFQDVMKQWRRMCKHYNSNIDMTCFDCPLSHNPACGELFSSTDLVLKEAEEAILQWAKENPEPVYPDWFNVLIKFGILSIEDRYDYEDLYYKLTNARIDPDIAYKLDISPINTEERIEELDRTVNLGYGD